VVAVLYGGLRTSSGHGEYTPTNIRIIGPSGCTIAVGVYQGIPSTTLDVSSRWGCFSAPISHDSASFTAFHAKTAVAMACTPCTPCTPCTQWVCLFLGYYPVLSRIIPYYPVLSRIIPSIIPHYPVLFGIILAALYVGAGDEMGDGAPPRPLDYYSGCKGVFPKKI